MLVCERRYHDIERVCARRDNVLRLWAYLLELLRARRARLELSLQLQQNFQVSTQLTGLYRTYMLVQNLKVSTELKGLYRTYMLVQNLHVSTELTGLYRTYALVQNLKFSSELSLD